MPELPPRAQSKIAALQDAEMQALTLLNSTQRSISEATYAHDINPHGDKAQAIAREITRLELLQPDQRAKHRALADLNAKIGRFLAMLPADAVLSDAKPVRMMKSDETHLQAVRRLRLRIDELISERVHVEQSTPSVKEMKQAAKRYVRALGERITPRLIIDRDRFSLTFGRGVIGEQDVTPLELLAWVDPSSLQDRLEQMINDLPAPAFQMTAVDRSQRLQEIASELYLREREECSHIRAALEEGTTIDYRAKTSIPALLGLAISGSAVQAA